MYSVVRFSGFRDELQLQAFGSAVNEIIPALYIGPDHRYKNRFSCSLSTDEDWFGHCDAIIASIRALAIVIRKARSSGVEIEIDIALHTADLRNRLLTAFSFPQEFLACIVMNEIGFRLSIYGDELSGDT